MKFTICETNCPYKDSMLGFLSQGYYPSSPKRPKYAFAIDVFELFHLIHMNGPSSKQGFCTAFQLFVESRKTLQNSECEVLYC